MGNYVSIPFINKGYQKENNNIFHVEPAVGRLANYFNTVDISTVETVNKLQNECKKDSSIMTKIWNSLNTFYTSSFAPSASNLVETKNEIISVDKNNHVYSVTERDNSWQKELETEFEYQSTRCGFKSNQFPKDCLEHTTQSKHRLRNIFLEKSCESSAKATCDSLRIKERDTKSEESLRFTFYSKQQQIPLATDYIEQSQDRTFTRSIFQRLDSGIEDSPYPCKTSALIDSNKQHLIDSCFEHLPYSIKPQIDLDSVYVTLIKMVDKQSSCVGKDVIDTTQGFKKSISFFIDVRDPLKQKPLCEEYNFSVYSECDSMFSDNDSESCSEDYLDGDDDFICFEESRSTEEDECGFNLTLNACSRGEFTCSVSANSPVRTYVDICMNTSPSISSSCNLSEPTMSVKIDILPNRKDSQSAQNPNYNIGSEYASPPTTPFNVCTANRKKPMSFDAGDFTNEASSNLKTSFCNTKKKKSAKKVCFEKDEDLVVIHYMKHWDFAYREARKGTWEQDAVDRCRFLRRIRELELTLGPYLRRKLELQNK